MKTQATPPTGKPQPFEINETFFSTTDPRGVITAGNAVFARTSGYAVEELVGQPHNLIRHPDMPRLVFQHLWQTIKTNRPFMGYVKNQAKNGNHYWVFAIVVPLPQKYLSVRIKPTSPLLAQIETVYRNMVDKEAEAIAQGCSESRAADASREVFAAAVAGLGFPNYEAFSHHALNHEIKCRDAEISRRSLGLFPATLDAAAAAKDDAVFGILYAQALTAYESISELFSSLDAFIGACRGIGERKDAVQAISEDFRLNAFNAHIAAHPLGADGITLGTVAEILRGHGQDLSVNVGKLAGKIVEITTAVADVASNLSTARIQIEMLLSFLAEIASAAHDAAELHRLRGIVADLHAGFCLAMEQGFRAIDVLRTELPDVLAAKEQLRKDMICLRVTQISGLTEVCRLSNAEGLHATFTGLRNQIATGQAELEQLDGMVDELRRLTNATPKRVEVVRRSVAHISETLALAGRRVPALRSEARPAARSDLPVQREPDRWNGTASRSRGPRSAVAV